MPAQSSPSTCGMPERGPHLPPEARGHEEQAERERQVSDGIGGRAHGLAVEVG